MTQVTGPSNTQANPQPQKTIKVGEKAEPLKPGTPASSSSTSAELKDATGRANIQSQNSQGLSKEDVQKARKYYNAVLGGTTIGDEEVRFLQDVLEKDTDAPVFTPIQIELLKLYGIRKRETFKGTFRFNHTIQSLDGYQKDIAEPEFWETIDAVKKRIGELGQIYRLRGYKFLTTTLYRWNPEFEVYHECDMAKAFYPNL